SATANATGGHAPPVHQTSSRSTEAHLEYLDRLKTSLQYQGSTVVLIVFAVIILGIQRVLGPTEIATILSGIAGFVLGQTKVQGDAGQQPSGEDDTHAADGGDKSGDGGTRAGHGG